MMLLAGIGIAVCLITLLVIVHRVTRCIHAWELVDKTVLPSGFENMAKAGVDTDEYWLSDVTKLAAQVVVLALRCPKCGAAKIFREESVR
jgi:hypothetical protein